jgi:hypothetical protein
MMLLLEQPLHDVNRAVLPELLLVGLFLVDMNLDLIITPDNATVRGTQLTVEQDFDNIKSQFQTENETILQHQIENIKRAQTTGVADFAKTFYQHVGSSEYWEIYSSLKEIVYLQNYLKANNIPYLFTCADNSILYNYTVGNSDSTIAGLVGQIRRDSDNWFWFPAGTKADETCDPRGFYQWALENKYPIGTTHPLEAAHRDAANLMKDKFNELVKKHIQ